MTSADHPLTLPPLWEELPGVAFRSSENFATDDHLGYYTQYEFRSAMVSVVILSNFTLDGSAPEDLLLMRLADATTWSNEAAMPHPDIRLSAGDGITNEIRAWIEAECRQTFRDLYPTIEPLPEPLSLYQYLHPQFVHLQLKTIDAKSCVVEIGDQHSWSTWIITGHPLHNPVQLSMNPAFLIVISSQVRILVRRQVLKVELENHAGTFRCKMNKFESSDTEREHDIYMKLSASNLDTLRVPKFKGYVVDSLETGTIGLLLEDIAIKHSMLQAAMGLTKYGMSDDGSPPELASVERRRKWIRQISDTVRRLHQIGIVWGDVKPENIIIDTNDDAWVIDFGRGYTMPWKTYHEKETMEGDLKALDRIISWLETTEMPTEHHLARDERHVSKRESIVSEDEADAEAEDNSEDDPRDDTGEEKLSNKRKRDATESTE